MHCRRRLIVQTLVFSRSYLHRQVSPPETLAMKGGTTWARIDWSILPESARLPRSIQGSFTCRKTTTWDKRLYFPSEGRRAEDFFCPEKSDGFGRVWTLELGWWTTKGTFFDSRQQQQIFYLLQVVQIGSEARPAFIHWLLWSKAPGRLCWGQKWV